MKKSILLVEDNEIIIKGLKYSLEQEGLDITVCKEANCVEDLINKQSFDLIILDITLPDGNGFDLCKNIKENNTDIPVIFLTARDEESDVVLGFNLGADDYIIKPFRNKELISRINNAFRRYNKNEDKIISQKVEIDTEANRVYVNKEEVIFTALEYKILLLLFYNLGKTVSREKILDKIWDIAGNFVNDNTLTVYIKRIRTKLGKYDVIKTIKGIGYRVDKE